MEREIHDRRGLDFRSFQRSLQFSTIYRKYLYYGLILLLALACGKIIYELLQILYWEGRGALTGDHLIYITVGRGILNGLHPYSDLFESKPPGIFYLSALSLLIGGTFLTRLLQAVTLVFLPLSLTWFAWRRGKNYESLIVILSAFIFGGLLAIQAEQFDGGLQSEMFALLPAILYVLTLRRKNIYLSALFILWTVAFREPYILGILAAAILYSKNLREFKEIFVYPFLVASCAGIILLLMSGLLGPFFHLYLPSMLQNRIQRNGPLLLHALWIHHYFGVITYYGIMPLIGVVVAILWAYSIVERKPFATLAVLLLGAVGVNEYWVLFTIIWKANTLGIGAWEVVTGLSWISLAYLLGTVLYGAYLWYLKDWRVVCKILIGLLAVALVSMSSDIGGDRPNYLLFGFPAFVVLLLMFIQNPQRHLSIILSSLLCMASLTYTFRFSGDLSSYIEATRDSQVLDHLMDSCGYQQYVFGGTLPVFAFSKHIPIGPIFTLYDHSYLGFQNDLYQQTYRNMDNAQILLDPIEHGKDPDPIPRSIRAQFNDIVPDCAKGYGIPGFSVRFRN